MPRVVSRLAVICFFTTFAVCAGSASPAKPAAGGNSDGVKLRFVVILTRHGVRSFTGPSAQLNRYSARPWPKWGVPPGYLTEHGARLMKLFGAYDRALLSSEGLFAAQGCAGMERVRIVADSEQRTRETGKALAEGFAPGCGIAVAALPERTIDPLFHPVSAGIGHPDKALAAASVEGRIGAHPQGVTEAYRAQLDELESILIPCASAPGCGANTAKSLFDVVPAMTAGKGEHLPELRSPLSVASSLTEDLLLEYTEGMPASEVGWGSVDQARLRRLLDLHTANEDLTLHPYYVARAQASNLLLHMLESMRQAVTGSPAQDALSKPDDRLLVLVGHDTNLAAIAGALNLSWLVDGRRDDTPPGGALVLELWSGGSGGDAVKVFYTAQTLDQMRNATPLTLTAPPERVPVYVPGCSRADYSCSWEGFEQILNGAIDRSFTR